MVSIRMPSCNSPRPATSMESFSLDSEICSATLPSASRNSRSRITRLCTLSPSVPASGESLMRNVMVNVAGKAFLDRRALESAEGKHLGDAAFFDYDAVAIEHFHNLIGAHRAGRDPAGHDSAEIGIGLEDRTEHVKRPVLDPRRRDMAHDKIE